MVEVWQRDSHGGVPHQPRPELPPADIALTAPSFAPVVFEELPALTVDADGWLQGAGVRHEPQGIDSGSGWHFGHPIGFLNHFTDGCGDPHDTLVSRGVSAHGCTLQDGTLVQYVPFTRLSFHAFDEAFYDIGWENAAAPGLACDFVGHQLCRLAQVNSVAVAWTKTKYGFDIPIERAPGGGFTAGLKCHTDGLAPGAVWDPNGHWDAPWRATGDPIAQWVSSGERAALDRSPWSAADFVAAVQHYAGGGDELAILSDDDQNFLRGVMRRFRLQGPPPADAGKSLKDGFDAADKVIDQANASPGGAGGVTKAALQQHAGDPKAHPHHHGTGLPQAGG